MSDWSTTGFRVTWLESSSFAGQPPTRHEKTVPSASEALELVREVSRSKPITQHGTYGAEVVELQERVERREMPVGVWGSR